MFKKHLALTALEIECHVSSGFEPISNMCPATPATSDPAVASIAGRIFLFADESALMANTDGAQSNVHLHIEATNPIRGDVLVASRCGVDQRRVRRVVLN